MEMERSKQELVQRIYDHISACFKREEKFPQSEKESLLPLSTDAKAVDEDSVTSETILKSTHRIPRREIPRAFEKLPHELWPFIVSNMSLSSISSLAFTCHWMLHVLGTGYWKAMKTNRKEKFIFLQPFDSAYPEHVLCPACARFHRRISDSHSRYGIFASPGRLHTDCRKILRHTMSLTDRNDLSWITLSLVLRAHKLGPEYGLDPDALSSRGRLAPVYGVAPDSYTAVHFRDSTWPEYHPLDPPPLIRGRDVEDWHTICKSRIIEDRLITHVQAFHPITHDNITRVSGPGGLFGCFGYHGVACSHLATQAQLAELCSSILHRPELSAWDVSQSFGYESHAHSCLFCPTTYRVRLGSKANTLITHCARLNNKINSDHVLVIQRWIDFGEYTTGPSEEWHALVGLENQLRRDGSRWSSPSIQNLLQKWYAVE